MIETLISSARNERIREILQLRDRRGRRRTGLILIEGQAELACALKSGISITSIFLCEDVPSDGAHGGQLVPWARRQGIPCYRVSRAVARKISYGDRLSPVLAIAAVQEQTLSDLDVRIRRHPSFVLVLDGFEKPGNVGAAFRVADGAGLDAVLLSNPVTDCWNPNTIRASLGTIFTLPFAEASAGDCVAWCRKHGLRIIVSTPSAEQIYSDEDLSVPSALVVGSEHQGADPAWLAAAASRVKIPMAGQADSLNAAVSTGILLYEALRQRMRSRNQTDKGTIKERGGKEGGDIRVTG